VRKPLPSRHAALRAAVLASAMAYVTPAFAYVDPNLGGLLFQVLAPLLAVMIAFWSRIKYAVALLVAKLKSLLSRKQ
jgi:hypothetical protein